MNKLSEILTALLYKDSDADSELDYISQTSWVMFLHHLDEQEQNKANFAQLKVLEDQYILKAKYR